MVEVIKGLEEKLGPEHRAFMRGWWRGSRWALKLRLPMRFLLAWSYNWQQRCTLMIITWLLPILLVTCVVVTLTAYGSKQLLEMRTHDSKVTAAPLLNKFD